MKCQYKCKVVFRWKLLKVSGLDTVRTAVCNHTDSKLPTLEKLQVCVCVIGRWSLPPYMGFRKWNGALPNLKVPTFIWVCVCASCCCLPSPHVGEFQEVKHRTTMSQSLHLCLCVNVSMSEFGIYIWGFRMWNGVLQGWAEVSTFISVRGHDSWTKLWSILFSKFCAEGSLQDHYWAQDGFQL